MYVNEFAKYALRIYSSTVLIPIRMIVILMIFRWRIFQLSK